MSLPRSPTYDRFIELRLVMYRKNITQAELAKYIGAESATVVSDRLRGKRDWRLDEMYKTLELLGLPLSQIYDYFPPEEVIQE